MNKTLPFTKSQIEKIIKNYPTPFHIYDEESIRKTARSLNKAFSWAPGFRNYFAVKATPNPSLIKIFKEEGMGVDCSSLPELIMAEKLGFKGEDIMFSANDAPYEEFKKAYQMKAIINLDDISNIPTLEKHAGIPEMICFRYNPGHLRRYKGNVLIGHPEEAKYGLTHEQLIEAYRIMKAKGVKRFGLHTMFASNELNEDAFIETANILIDAVIEISEKVGIKFEFINLGGGIGIPHKPDDKPVDLEFVSSEIKKIYENKIIKSGRPGFKIISEYGRVLTGPNGYLVSKVINLKDIYKKYVGLDASMANLMRPAIYGAYHHITVLGKENHQNEYIYDVTGSLCENNDKFAIDRKLPKIEIGDIIVIHDTGAHGHAMGFNYNGKLRSAELLLRPDKSVKLIRRAETVDDLFATLDFTNL